jgi:hypothetical protein
LIDLRCLEAVCGSAERATVLPALVAMIARSRNALWGMDFPFGLPTELVDLGADWSAQLDFLRRFSGGAAEFGRWCVAHARRDLGRMHVRRVTDTETATPFDCYHYRIIYQTFHGMRDVLAPLARSPGTAILPFHAAPPPRSTRRIVVETCPASTLKRLRLPHRNYKQPTGGALTLLRRRTRRQIVEWLATRVLLAAPHRRVMMRNPGADALDAVIAAVGAFDAYTSADLAAIAAHPRYRHEGLVFA